MPDISMCQDDKCPRREKCYRYRAIPLKYQDYFLSRRKGKKCEDFMQIRKYDRLMSMEELNIVSNIVQRNLNIYVKPEKKLDILHIKP